MRADFNGSCSLCGESGHGQRDCVHKDAAGGVAVCIRVQPVEEETTLSMGAALIAPSMVKANTLSTCHVISNPGLPNDIQTICRIRANGLNDSVVLDKQGTMPGVGLVISGRAAM